jgi:hypothetical protein
LWLHLSDLEVRKKKTGKEQFAASSPLNGHVGCRYLTVSLFSDLQDPIVLVGIFPVALADMHGPFISVQASSELRSIFKTFSATESV